MAIILIAAIAIPNLQRSKIAANESSAQRTGLRAFCDDQTGVIQFVSPGAAAIRVAAGSNPDANGALSGYEVNSTPATLQRPEFGTV